MNNQIQSPKGDLEMKPSPMAKPEVTVMNNQIQSPEGDFRQTVSHFFLTPGGFLSLAP